MHGYTQSINFSNTVRTRIRVDGVDDELQSQIRFFELVPEKEPCLGKFPIFVDSEAAHDGLAQDVAPCKEPAAARALLRSGFTL